MKYNPDLNLNRNLRALLGCETPESIFVTVRSIIKERDKARRLDGLVITDTDGVTLEWALSEGVVEIPHSTQPQLPETDTMRKDRDELLERQNTLESILLHSGYWKENLRNSVSHLIEIATAPDAPQAPQLSEIRYALHGDIQPCSVLYSDDTTTLLRLDEGDMMLETDTIEWSDSVTYRCQELLKGESKRSNIPVTLSPVKLLAQLVRDERILLNDNGGDEAVEHRCSECNTPTNGSDCCVKVQER